MRTYERGYTFLEVMTTLVIFSILFGFSISFIQNTQDTPVKIRKKEFINILDYARLQSFLREESLVLAPMHLDKNHEWQDGMNLFAVDPTTHVQNLIHQWHWSPHRYQMFWNGFQSKDWIVIDSDPSKLAMNGTFNVKNKSGCLLAQWKVNRLGRIQ